jgi:hypothetical protein
MLGLELGEEARNRIHGPEDLGVLEDEGDRSPTLPRSPAARQDDYRKSNQEDTQACCRRFAH